MTKAADTGSTLGRKLKLTAVRSKYKATRLGNKYEALSARSNYKSNTGKGESAPAVRAAGGRTPPLSARTPPPRTAEGPPPESGR